MGVEPPDERDGRKIGIQPNLFKELPWELQNDQQEKPNA